MAERVLTGGNVSFEYKKGHKPKLDERDKKEIERGYEQYYGRRRKEKKKRIIITIIIAILIIILILTMLFLKSS